MNLIGKYTRSELAHLNFVGGEADEGVGDAICLAARAAGAEIYACDFEGTTDGRATATGWNCLILAEDREAWEAAAKKYGAEVYEAKGEIVAGHYGDGHWNGVDLVEVPRREGEFYWIDLEN